MGSPSHLVTEHSLISVNRFQITLDLPEERVWQLFQHSQFQTMNSEDIVKVHRRIPVMAPSAHGVFIIVAIEQPVTTRCMNANPFKHFPNRGSPVIAGKAEVEQPMMIVQIFKEAPLEPGIAVIRHRGPEFSKQPCVSLGNASVNLRGPVYRGRAKRFAGRLQVTPSKSEHCFRVGCTKQKSLSARTSLASTERHHPSIRRPIRDGNPFSISARWFPAW
jgi:hypothetical protein